MNQYDEVQKSFPCHEGEQDSRDIYTAMSGSRPWCVHSLRMPFSPTPPFLTCNSGASEPMKSNPRVWQLAVDSVLSSTNKINVGTNRGSPVNGDLKARKSSRRREKKLLARSVRKQLAAASIIHQGKTQTGATHVKMTRKERRKLDTTVSF